jgi:hypothetical protein
MVMKRCLLVLAALVPLATGACNKPTQDECRKAISNMERLLGTEAASRNADNEGDVRRCRGGSSKEAVDCAIKATTLDELKACAFMGSKGKSATAPSAPSAPSASAPTPGSAAPAAPAPGSAAPAAPTPAAPAPGAPEPGAPSTK